MSIIACEKVPIFDKINNNIFLGDIVAVSNINLIKNIDIIINLTHEKYTKYNHIKYFDFSIEDNREVKINFFKETNEIISEAIKNNKRILIHCYNGVSRSVTILLAYFISTGISLKDSLSLIKNNRVSKQYTRPNIGFMKQLIVYEREILFDNSLTLNEFIAL